VEVNLTKLSEIINKLGLENINKKPINDDTTITYGYVGDLLSQVLASAKGDCVWMTIQNHMNVIGVAVMAGIPAIVICEGHEVPVEVIEKADEEHIALFKSEDNSFQISGKLYECGIR
jgi:serine kinase of HPr protein (carbohydrate metabolism regulator)